VVLLFVRASWQAAEDALRSASRGRGWSGDDRRFDASGTAVAGCFWGGSGGGWGLVHTTERIGAFVLMIRSLRIKK